MFSAKAQPHFGESLNHLDKMLSYLKIYEQLKTRRASHPWQVPYRTGVLFLIFAASLFVCDVLLVRQNWHLKHTIEGGLISARLEPGEKLSPLRGVDLSGRAFTISYNAVDGDILLLIFAPGCKWCDENMPYWQSLLAALKDTNTRIVGVSMRRNGLAEYIQQHKLSDILILTDIDPGDIHAYKLRETPETILLNSDGSVKKVWYGAFTAEQRRDIEGTFNLTLTHVDIQ